MPNLAVPLSDKIIPIESSGMLDNNSVREEFLDGSLLDGRTFKTFLCNYYTKEMVDEEYDKGKLNTALFWEYDTRLGRQWNLDSKKLMSIYDDKLIKVQDIDCDILISAYKNKVEVDIFKLIEDLKLYVVFTKLREVYCEKK